VSNQRLRKRKAGTPEVRTVDKTRRIGRTVFKSERVNYLNKNLNMTNIANLYNQPERNRGYGGSIPPSSHLLCNLPFRGVDDK